ncbi:hypothetical protein HZA97_01400 [Candidatus Woesearchaeota archaeon]|nr:hypothetical protein [Candidatus Woesearchaeota archaeon]
MGEHTYAEPVPFKIKVWFGQQGNKTNSQFLDDLLDYLENGTYEYFYGSKQGQPLPEFERAGWKLMDFLNGEENEGERYGTLITSVFSKENHKVHYVNESKYSSVGEEDTCFFSDDRETLEKFCDDLGFDKSKIEANKAVKQTV